MVKEVKSKNSLKKRSVSGIATSPRNANKNFEKMLVDNFVSLQKVMTSLAYKFDKLEKQMSSLLELFEDSAKTIAEKEINLELKGNEEKQQEILSKLKEVLDQNKLIAKGITLMHEASVMNFKEPVAPKMIENKNILSNMTPSRPMTKSNETFSTPETMPSFKKSIVKEDKEGNPSFGNSSVNFSI